MSMIEFLITLTIVLVVPCIVVSTRRIKRIAADAQAIRGLLWRQDTERAADRELKKALDGIHYAVVIDRNEPEDPEPDGVGCTLRIEMDDEEETNEEGRSSE